MEITTGQTAGALSVPATAIRWRVAPSGGVLSTQSTAYVWVAEPTGRENEYSVRAVDVRAGASDGVNTAILTGLREGQRVVTAGYEYLKNGDTVSLETDLEARPAAPAHLPGTGEHGHSMPGM